MLQGKQLQLLIENVKDRLVGVPGLTQDALIPMETPGIELIIKRDISRVIASVENEAKIALSPKRLTRMPKSAREAYENKIKYERMECFTTYESLVYPRWEDLSTEQKEPYLADPTEPDGVHFYSDGTLHWDLLTKVQQRYLDRYIITCPNKVGEEEKLDGKNRAHIKLRNRNIIQIHKVTLRIRNAQTGDTAPFLSRTYGPNEYFVYEKTGELILTPLMSQLGMVFGVGINYTSYGLNIPAIPQILHVDYTYGMEEIPLDLMDAVAMKTACKVFENINMMYTQGLMSYSVQGFSASFGKGMYTDTMERYNVEAQNIINRYKAPVMSAQ